MTITDLTIHNDLSFDHYQRLPGHSYSSIKADGRLFEPTPKMALGSAVHSYILEPHTFGGDIRIVKPMANALLRCVGSTLFKYLLCECSITCQMEFEGFKMAYRGRMDIGKPKIVVIDIKIGENVRKSMDFFGYQHAISGYALAIEAPLALIIALDPRQKQPVADVIPVKISSDYWHEQILLRGEMIENEIILGNYYKEQPKQKN